MSNPGVLSRSGNASLSLHTSKLSSPDIQCFLPKPGRGTTSISGCRPTLNEFRNFPRYRVVQDFLEGRWPREPSEPPYALHATASNCAVRIASGDPKVIDKFSFEQVRQLATDIVEECQEKGGLGGIAPIGKGLGWTVAVVGTGAAPLAVNGSAALYGLGLAGNASASEAR
ncbi:hypothetical protein MMC28_009532 [Mycoblastus sanguinarius]|nr:hypothetical protein [Mycoblastus sanguinarius]